MYSNTISQGLFLAFSLVSSTSALGINCRGSANCNTFGNDQIAFELTQAIAGISLDRWYDNGQHIACVGTGAPITGNGGFCAFLQNTSGAPGRNIKGLAHFIPEHGCKTCGSVPYFFPSDNNVNNGQLTYNYVSDSCSQDDARLC